MRLYIINILILLSFGFTQSQLFNNRLNGLLNLFRARPVGPRHSLPRPRQPPLAARQIRGRPRPQDARLRSQQPDKEARFARAPVLKNYVPPAATTTTVVTTTAATTTTTSTSTTKTTTTVQLKSTQQLYFGGENTESELQWYPMENEKVIELQNYKHESWKNEILPSPEPLQSSQKNIDPMNVSPENIIDLTSTLQSGDQRPAGFIHVHLDENQVTELDYTYGPGPGDQVVSLHGQGAHYGSPDHTDHSLAHHQDSIGQRVTAESHSGVTLPFLHQDAEPDFDYSISLLNNEPATPKYGVNTEDFTTQSTYGTESEDSFEDFYNEVEDQADYAEENDNIIERNVNDDDNGVPEARRNLPNANFKSDFFKTMNIQEMVFSIPSHFRKYLDEPPEWINKEYW